MKRVKGIIGILVITICMGCGLYLYLIGAEVEAGLAALLWASLILLWESTKMIK